MIILNLMVSLDLKIIINLGWRMDWFVVAWYCQVGNKARIMIHQTSLQGQGYLCTMCNLPVVKLAYYIA